MRRGGDDDKDNDDKNVLMMVAHAASPWHSSHARPRARRSHLQNGRRDSSTSVWPFVDRCAFLAFLDGLPPFAPEEDDEDDDEDDAGEDISDIARADSQPSKPNCEIFSARLGLPSELGGKIKHLL